MADYQNLHIHSENFSLGLFRTRQEPSPLAAALSPVSWLCFQAPPRAGEAWDVGSIRCLQGTRPWSGCPALLCSSEFSFLFLSLSPVLSDLELAWFGGEPVKGGGVMPCPAPTPGAALGVQGSLLVSPCPARHGPCLSHPALSVSFCTSHSAPLSVRLSVPSVQGRTDQSGGFRGTLMSKASHPHPHIFPGCFCLYFPHMTFKYSPANPRESNPLVFCVCDCAKFINEQISIFVRLSLFAFE